jgi:hypothetical protein
LSSADIAASAQASSSSTIVRMAEGSANGYATVTGLGGLDASAEASVFAYAQASALPYAIWQSASSIFGQSSVSCNGVRIGDNWSNVSSSDNSWSDVSQNNNTWTQTQSSSNTWLRQG